MSQVAGSGVPVSGSNALTLYVASAPSGPVASAVASVTRSGGGAELPALGTSRQSTMGRTRKTRRGQPPLLMLRKLSMVLPLAAPGRNRNRASQRYPMFRPVGSSWRARQFRLEEIRSKMRCFVPRERWNCGSTPVCCGGRVGDARPPGAPSSRPASCSRPLCPSPGPPPPSPAPAHPFTHALALNPKPKPRHVHRRVPRPAEPVPISRASGGPAPSAVNVVFTPAASYSRAVATTVATGTPGPSRARLFFLAAVALGLLLVVAAALPGHALRPALVHEVVVVHRIDLVLVGVSIVLIVGTLYLLAG